MMALPYLGLGAYIVTSIFYIMPSGLPQPADLLILLTMAWAIVLWQNMPRFETLYVILAIFCIWILTVNMYWFAFFGSRDFLLKSAYYTFNALVFTLVVVAGWRDQPRLYTVVRWACIIALFAQLSHILLVGTTTTSGVRTIGTFNNPNQLGYWVLLAMTMLAITKERQPLNMIDIAALAAGGYAALVSLSKGATISGAVLILMILAFRRVTLASSLVAVVLIGSGIALSQFSSVGLIDRISNLTVVSSMDHRLRTNHRDDDIMARGYQVIINNPQHWALGAGEGAFPRRFAGDILKLEIHSTIGNLFFSYGMVGLTLFVVLLWLVFSRAPWSSCAYFIPIMMYGITHMGLRFSEFWIFLALVYVQGHCSSQDNERTAMVTTGSPPHRTRAAPQWSLVASSSQDTDRTEMVTKVSSPLTESMRA